MSSIAVLAQWVIAHPVLSVVLFAGAGVWARRLIVPILTALVGVLVALAVVGIVVVIGSMG
jgi:hypothetical protein